MHRQPIRIGVIGAGANTRRKHIPLLQQIDGVQVAGVVNRSGESSRRVAEAFDIPRVYDRWEEAVADEEVDAIVIGTWPYLHCPCTLAALEAGRHVLTEARMAMNLDEAGRMLAASRARPEWVAQVVPSPLTLGVDATIRRLLSEGWLGTLLVVEVRVRSEFLDREAPIHWRQDKALSGENIMMLGIYYEAIARWCGHATEVSAKGRVFAEKRRDAEGRERVVEIPDHLEVTADMACGALLHLQQSTVMPFNEGEGIWLFGDEGVLRFHEGKLWGARKGEEALKEIEIPENERGGWRVEEEFIGAIRGEEKVRLTTFEEGARYMAFTGAVNRSLANGGTVRVPAVAG